RSHAPAASARHPPRPVRPQPLATHPPLTPPIGAIASPAGRGATRPELGRRPRGPSSGSPAARRAEHGRHPRRRPGLRVPRRRTREARAEPVVDTAAATRHIESAFGTRTRAADHRAHGHRRSPVHSRTAESPLRTRATDHRTDHVEPATTAAHPAPLPPYPPRPFRPAWWLPGPHAQTIAGRMLRLGRSFPLRRERIETPDGDFLDLDFTPAPREGAPRVLLLHGLEGSARRGYALITYAELAAAGLQGVGLNFRSCSGEPNRLPRLYHSGETGDLRFVLDHLAERFPDVRRGATGFSLGGNVLLKLLGEEGEGARRWLETAVAISVPYDLAAGADHLER